MKYNNPVLRLCAALAAAVFMAACGHETPDTTDNTKTDDSNPVVTPSKPISYLYFNGDSAHDLDYQYDKTSGVATIKTTGTDPYIRLKAFTTKLPADSCVLSFEYSTFDGLSDNVQLFFGPPEAQPRRVISVVLSSVIRYVI